MEQVRGYLALDHGPCPERGPTNPVIVETEHYTSKVFVPAKCEHCRFLELEKARGFVCNFERAKWGAFPRTLDWGTWSPTIRTLVSRVAGLSPLVYFKPLRRSRR